MAREAGGAGHAVSAATHRLLLLGLMNSAGLRVLRLIRLETLLRIHPCVDVAMIHDVVTERSRADGSWDLRGSVHRWFPRAKRMPRSQTTLHGDWHKGNLFYRPEAVEAGGGVGQSKELPVFLFV